MAHAALRLPATLREPPAAQPGFPEHAPCPAATLRIPSASRMKPANLTRKPEDDAPCFPRNAPRSDATLRHLQATKLHLRATKLRLPATKRHSADGVLRLQRATPQLEDAILLFPDGVRNSRRGKIPLQRAVLHLPDHSCFVACVARQHNCVAMLFANPARYPARRDDTKSSHGLSFSPLDRGGIPSYVEDPRSVKEAIPWQKRRVRSPKVSTP